MVGVITSMRARPPAGRAPRIQGAAMTSPTDTPDLPEYAPLPAIAQGAALNEHGYHVWPVERNLYAVTDNVYMSAFLTTSDGVVIFDAPPNIALRRERVGRGQCVPRRHHRARGGSDHRQIHRRAGRCRHRDLHQDHDVRDHAVDSPRPRPQRPGPSLTATGGGCQLAGVSSASAAWTVPCSRASRPARDRPYTLPSPVPPHPTLVKSPARTRAWAPSSTSCQNFSTSGPRSRPLPGARHLASAPTRSEERRVGKECR